jgi:beta-phosphoglucomutase
MKLEAVLFDFDGVIANSKTVHAASWNFAASTILGIELKPLSEYQISGLSTAKISRIICAYHDQEDQHKLVLKAKNKYLEENAHKIEFFPKVGELFDMLKTHNIPFGIASNASKFFIKKCLEHWGFKVSVVYGYEDYSNPKPDPEPYLKLAKELNINSSQHKDVLIFEDSETGLNAALASKMQVAYIQSECIVSRSIIARTDFKFSGLSEALNRIKIVLD